MSRYETVIRQGDKDCSLIDKYTGDFHLIEQGWAICDQVADGLNNNNYNPATEVGELVEQIRNYDKFKSRPNDRYRIEIYKDTTYILDTETGDQFEMDAEFAQEVTDVLNKWYYHGRNISPVAYQLANQVLLWAANAGGKEHGREQGYQDAYNYLGSHGLDCCLGDYPPLEGECIGQVKYIFEKGDNSVGIPDYSFFELTLAPGFKIVKED